MIFVAVGTQLPFDRLITAVDRWAAAAGERNVIAQAGGTQAKLQAIRAENFIPPRRFQDLQRQAALLVGHAGMGTILGALDAGKPLVIMPRKAALGEHRNDHQLATAQHFRHTPGIHVAMDEDELIKLLDRRAELAAPSTGLPKSAAPELIATLRAFIGLPQAPQRGA